MSASNATPSNSYDYIITGAGCAGLSLLMHLIKSGGFANKKILLIDKDAKQQNDRTWCFWEKGEGLFQPLVKKEWSTLWFHAPVFSTQLDIRPYQYKLIRGIDFYNHCLETIAAHSNITFLAAEVQKIFSNASAGTGVVANGITYTTTFIFNSILFQKPIVSAKQYWLLQHFKGWFVETETPQFASGIGTLMDFRTDQSQGATFFYVLPLSPTEALVEYTLFSKKILPDEVYETALQQYVSQTLQLKDFIVKEKEFGVIPMTNYAFPAGENNIINLGTAGGQTKASSGYTFQFIQKHSAAIVDALQSGKQPFSNPHAYSRFHFYDSVLLHILHHGTLPGAGIFTDLFKQNPPQRVLKFLDNETNLLDELRLISSLPTLPFLKAALKQLTPFS